MTYLLLDSQGAIAKYPASLADVRKANPSVSFPRNPSDDLLHPYGWRPVIKSPEPAHDAFHQQLTEGTPAEIVPGQWEQTWQITEIPADQLPFHCDYAAFWDALIAAPVYQVIRQQATTDLNVNTCCTEFIAAMTDAKNGRPNKDAIQMCITLLMQSLTLTSDQTAELQSLLSVGDLDRVYSLNTP